MGQGDIFFSPFLSTVLNLLIGDIINQCFFHKNENRCFQFVFLDYADTYFVQGHSDAPQKYFDQCRIFVVKMLEYLIDNN